MTIPLFLLCELPGEIYRHVHAREDATIDILLMADDFIEVIGYFKLPLHEECVAYFFLILTERDSV